MKSLSDLLTPVTDSTERLRLEAFGQMYSTPEHLWLARCAAFPVALTTDLLYKIWLNFRQTDTGETLDIPINVVGDILLSPLCREIGYDLYEMYPETRALLWQSLPPAVVASLAEFTLRYLDFCRDKSPSDAFTEAQRIWAESFLHPQKVAQLLRQLLSERKTNAGSKIMADYVLSWVKNRNQWANQTFSETTTQRDSLSDLAQIAEGIQQYEKGQVSEANATFSSLAHLLHVPRESGFNVPIPKEIWENFKPIEDESYKTSKQNMSNIYALIVGINAYEDRIVMNKRVIFPRLRGCVSDAQKVKKYLENETAFGMKNITLLTDQQATKAEVVKAFLELGKAQKDDVVVFYYSGHGTQEKADTDIWIGESNGKHDCLVCYCDEQSKDDYLLVDKELRYLIHQVVKTKAHVVILSDCCYSGDNTRNSDIVKTTYKEVIERRVPYVFPQRTWDKFIFNNSLDPADFQGMHIDNVFPPNQYVSLSACKSEESAVEVEGEGIFTKYLLKTLETSKGQISYSALRGRIQQMTDNAFGQTPNLYISSEYKYLLTSINVFNISNNISNREKTDCLKIHLKNIDNILTDSQLLAEKLLIELSNQVELETEEKRADYTLSLRNGRAVLTRPLDTFRPLVEPIALDSEDFANELVRVLKHLSNWHFLKNLQNDSTLKNPLKIEMIDANGEPIVLQNNTAQLHYELINNQWKGGIGVKITNTTSLKLYFCCVYLDTRFGSSLELLEPTVTPLDPGASTQLSYKGNTTIPMFLESHVRLYNWSKNVEYLQFIVSTTDLSNVEELTMESLPTPFTLKKKATMRGLGLGEEEINKVQAATWTTQQLTLEFINPEYNTVRESELEAMLQDENLAEYALGNYFNVVNKAILKPSYQLKTDVQLRKTDAYLDEKGFISDTLLNVANQAARTVRNSKYQMMRLRFPKIPKIVSLGDSWLYHPLITDIVDHLSRTYAIYCVAAAGDTLQNYDAEGEWLEAVEYNKPTFFLISGGGNDVLGEQFRNHIKKGPHPTGLPPQDYLEPSLIQELDNLQRIYRKMFTELFAVRAEIHVLCHGYDYIIPLETTKKGWLGRYMIEKGMTSQADRKAVLRYIIDEFNTRLQYVASEFTNVHYINQRNAVKDDQWYDEGHPNSNGFETIAGRFMEKINDLLAV